MNRIKELYKKEEFQNLIWKWQENWFKENFMMTMIKKKKLLQIEIN
jgi:hypothetical protein